MQVTIGEIVTGEATMLRKARWVARLVHQL
jgi:hypothetical protein